MTSVVGSFLDHLCMHTYFACLALTYPDLPCLTFHSLDWARLGLAWLGLSRLGSVRLGSAEPAADEAEPRWWHQVCPSDTGSMELQGIVQPQLSPLRGPRTTAATAESALLVQTPEVRSNYTSWVSLAGRAPPANESALVLKGAQAWAASVVERAGQLGQRVTMDQVMVCAPYPACRASCATACAAPCLSLRRTIHTPSSTYHRVPFAVQT